jgi:hypothetical protein
VAELHSRSIPLLSWSLVKMRESENVQKFPRYASIALVVPLPVLQYSKYCAHGRRYYCWVFLVKYWSTVVVQYEFFSPNSNGNTQQKMRVETSDLKYHTSDAPPTVSYLPALRYSKPCSWSRSPLESTSSFGHDRVRGTGTSYRYHTHHASSTRLTRHLSSNRNVCDAVLLFV